MRAVEIRNDGVVVSSGFSFALIRTDRVEHDGRVHPMPAHLGRLPIRSASEYRSKVPASWNAAQALFVPVYDGEALWIDFEPDRPHAVMVRAQGVNAITGLADGDRLSDNPQNYVVAPPQKWLDGVNAGDGRVRQFVAHPGGADRVGTDAAALQVMMVPPKPGTPASNLRLLSTVSSDAPLEATYGFEIRGEGTIEQRILPDPFGVATWEAEHAQMCELFLVDVTWFEHVTGERGPDPPPPRPLRSE